MKEYILLNNMNEKYYIGNKQQIEEWIKEHKLTLGDFDEGEVEIYPWADEPTVDIRAKSEPILELVPEEEEAKPTPRAHNKELKALKMEEKALMYEASLPDSKPNPRLGHVRVQIEELGGTTEMGSHK